MSTGHGSLLAAAKTWNDRDESLESVNARIHGGVPLDKLNDRANDIVHTLFRHFPYAAPRSGAKILEIGSGTGYIMEGMNEFMKSNGRSAERIVGLDIAEHMIDKAKRRLGDNRPYSFLHYDGVTMPSPGDEYDLIYSVACLQHIPKPYVYNLFFEIQRALKTDGFALFHFLPFSHLRHQEAIFPWREEVKRQVRNEEGHWHHFYSFEELHNVLQYGHGFAHVDICDADALWCCVGKRHRAA